MLSEVAFTRRGTTLEVRLVWCRNISTTREYEKIPHVILNQVTMSLFKNICHSVTQLNEHCCHPVQPALLLPFYYKSPESASSSAILSGGHSIALGVGEGALVRSPPAHSEQPPQNQHAAMHTRSPQDPPAGQRNVTWCPKMASRADYTLSYLHRLVLLPRWRTWWSKQTALQFVPSTHKCPLSTLQEFGS